MGARAASLVVGYGSIGARHHRLLCELGEAPAVVSRRGLAVAPLYADLPAALAAERPRLVVLASETGRHAADLATLAGAGYRGRVLVEKPLFAEPQPLPPNRFAALHVGYNLRFLPVVGALREALAERRPILVRAAVGQHLADWRPGRALDSVYSADPARGGGALRDLSHELDLLTWLFGPWRRVTALGGASGRLGHAADDHWAILLESAAGLPVALTLDALSRPGHRGLTVETDRGTLSADLVTGRLASDARAEEHPAERDGSYRSQLQAVLAGDDPRLCDAEAGLAVLRLVAAIEEAAAGGRWIAL